MGTSNDSLYNYSGSIAYNNVLRYIARAITSHYKFDASCVSLTCQI